MKADALGALAFLHTVDAATESVSLANKLRKRMKMLGIGIPFAPKTVRQLLICAFINLFWLET